MAEAKKKVGFKTRLLAKGGRQSKNVVDERQKARGGTRLESFGIPFSEKQYGKRQRPKSGQALPKPKTDIGKASVKGIDKAMMAEYRQRKARDARVALVVGTPDKPKPKTDVDTFIRKLTAASRTRVPKIKKGPRPTISMAQISKTSRPRKKK